MKEILFWFGSDILFFNFSGSEIGFILFVMIKHADFFFLSTNTRIRLWNNKHGKLKIFWRLKIALQIEGDFVNIYGVSWSIWMSWRRSHDKVVLTIVCDIVMTLKSLGALPSCWECVILLLLITLFICI